MVDVPVIIIASNRPLYLYRTLKTLLTIPGANTSLTTVFVDGLFQEPVDVAKLLGVNVINHEPSGKGGTRRISQNYKASLTKAFDIYPVCYLDTVHVLAFINIHVIWYMYWHLVYVL